MNTALSALRPSVLIIAVCAVAALEVPGITALGFRPELPWITTGVVLEHYS
jgi:hypothetical protein